MAAPRKLDMPFVKSIQPTHRNEEYPDTEVRGFRLYVSKAGSKSFGFRRNPFGYKAIGKVGEVSIGDARKIAAQWKTEFNAGRNPIEEMKRKQREMREEATQKIPTMAEAFEQYKAMILIMKSESHRKNMARSMEKHFLSSFGGREVGKVSRRELIAFREKHEGKRSAEMHQMKAYISAFYKWMSETSAYMDYIEGPPNIGTVKAVRNIRTNKLTEENDIRAYWRALDTVSPRAASLALQFKFLSNKRGIEVQRMTPDQIDFRRKIWTLPEVRFKAKGVQQPLTPKMLELIREALGNRSSGYVFSSTDGDKRVTFGTKIKKHLTAESKCPYISYHDYRRTFSTKLQELYVDPRVISLTEGHYDRGIEAHYQQGKQKPLDEQLDAYLKWEKLLGLKNG